MPAVIIKSIGAQSILDDGNYQYLLDNLNKPLPLMSLNFTPDGDVFALGVYAKDSCITLFVDSNKLDYEVIRCQL